MYNVYYYMAVAQLVTHPIPNRTIEGSSPFRHAVTLKNVKNMKNKNFLYMVMILLLAIFIVRVFSIFFMVLGLFALFDIWRGVMSWEEYGIGALRVFCVGCMAYIVMGACGKMMCDVIKRLWSDLLP